MNCIAVDDEPLALDIIEAYVNKHPDLTLIARCNNAAEASEVLKSRKVDLMFLDIQMPGMSGFDVVSNLQQDNMPLVVFVTAFDQYAVEAFDVDAVDYLLKPIDDERLTDAVKRAQEHLQRKGSITDKQRLLELIISITGKSETSVAQLLKDHSGVRSYPERIAIKDGGETTLVETKDIDWVDAAGDYMCVHANDCTHVMRITMKDLEAQLDPSTFQRVHRSTIVNLERVVKVCSHMNGEFYLKLNNGSAVKMSRSYKDKVKHFF